MLTALSIAGSDPSGGAGIQGDLKTFTAHGVHGLAALTALTAQNTTGVRGVHDVPAEFVASQLEAILDDVPVHAAKTGMVSRAETIEAVCDVLAGPLREGSLPWLVVDPVAVATSGDPLLAEDALGALMERLVPLASLLTPNLAEARLLCGFAVETVEDMRRAAEALHERGSRAVLVKGGHLAGDRIVDVLLADGDFSELESKRIGIAGEIHGTGCALSASIAAHLARGSSLLEAVESARAYVMRGIKSANALGRGARPFNHLA